MLHSSKIVLFGSQSSGKTQLFGRITNGNDHVFAESLNPTMGVDYNTRIIHPEILGRFWDLSGNDKFSLIVSHYYCDTAIALLCIDLTTKIDEVKIKKKINAFHEKSANTQVILVGTKADLVSDNTVFNKFEGINLKACGAVDAFIVSAKTNKNVDALFECISKICCSSLWQDARNKFLLEIQALPKNKKGAIITKLAELEGKIFSATDTQAKTDAINEFTQSCHKILNGKYSNVAKAVLAIAAAAVVTVLAALVGFAIGFALGAWSGPGAFITGLIGSGSAACAVASTSVVLGVTSGSLTAYGLFKESKEKVAVNKFVDQLSDVLNKQTLPGILGQ